MMVPTRHSSSIFRPYPAEPYINRKLSVWAFQRCIVHLQQSSFGPDLPGLLLTVNILGQEGDQSPRVINECETPVIVHPTDSNFPEFSIPRYIVLVLNPNTSQKPVHDGAHSSQLIHFSSLPYKPYINGKRSVSAFQRCMVHLQQSSFSPHFPGHCSTVSRL